MSKLIVLSCLMLTGFGLVAAQQNLYNPDVGRPITFDRVPPPSMIPEIACGKRNQYGAGVTIDRTAAGPENQARFGEFPWVVAILPRIWARQTVQFVPCGGSLIHPQAVLTTTFCVIHEHPDNLVIRAGEWDIRSTSERFPHQDRFVEKIISPDLIDARLYKNDYAILILKNPFDISPHINVVCLPRRNENLSGSRCFAAGWGKNVSGQRQTVLKKTVSTIIPNNECERLLQAATANDALVLYNSHLCSADSVSVGMCQGDIGFPLVCPRRIGSDIRYIQTGIVAWGIACADPKKPVVYSNVGFARSWIDRIMAQNNLQSSWYTY